MGYHGSTWVNFDVTTLSGTAALAATDTGVTTYLAPDGPRVYYVDTNRHVNEVGYHTSEWANYDVTVLAGTAEFAGPGSGITVYLAFDGPRIYYADANQHIDEIGYHGSNGWANFDITSLANAGVLAASGTGLVSYLADDGPRIYYVDSDQHVNEIGYHGSTWANFDVKILSGSGTLAVTDMGASIYSAGDGPRVYYVDVGQHLNEMGYHGSVWANFDLTVLSGGPLVETFYTISGQVQAGGSGFSGVMITLSGTTAGGTAISRTATTDANGNYLISAPAGGNYTVTPSQSGFTFNPASQTFSNVSGNQSAQATTAAGGSATPPSCMNVTPSYLGTWQLNAAGNVAVTATVSTSVTKVDFLIYDEQSQSLSSAASYDGTLSPSSDVLGYNQYTVTVPISTFQALGSYAVTASVQDSNQHTASCTLANSSFFAIVNDSAEPSNLNGHSNAGCGSLAGSWTDQAGIQSGETTDRWDLTQSGNTISGTQTVSLGPSCGSIVWQVSGSILDSTKGTFTLTATNPSVAEDQCGFVSATNVTINPLTVSGPACDTASGTEADTYPPEYGNDSFSTTWNATVSVPSGETSQFDRWGPDGYDNQGLFKGKLTTSTGTSQFSGRRVQESFPVDLADGCAALDSSNTIGAQHASGTGSNWTVLADSTYTDDWIGYGPAITRYYQTRVGTCSLVAPQQIMSISSDSNQWVQYKVNRLEYDVTPTGVTAKRDTESPTPASGSRTYPQ